jgi:hypothetical protein
MMRRCIDVYFAHPDSTTSTMSGDVFKDGFDDKVCMWVLLGQSLFQGGSWWSHVFDLR